LSLLLAHTFLPEEFGRETSIVSLSPNGELVNARALFARRRTMEEEQV
jgi:hypothetical protein